MSRRALTRSISTPAWPARTIARSAKTRWRNARRGSARSAEAARGRREIVYIVGTEVPIPGGETEALDALAVTRPEAALRTFERHRAAFASHGLDRAIGDVVGLVVQPGVDMGNTQVFYFDKAKAGALSAAALTVPGVVFEAHSTDFQTGGGSCRPGRVAFRHPQGGASLTFAFREAVVAMAAIEERLGASGARESVEALATAMNENPVHWRPYIPVDERQELLKIFGLSDRIRYYWPQPKVDAALKTLLSNIDAARAPPGIVSQFVGKMLADDQAGPLSERIIQAKVGAVVEIYRRACHS